MYIPVSSVEDGEKIDELIELWVCHFGDAKEWCATREPSSRPAGEGEQWRECVLAEPHGAGISVARQSLLRRSQPDVDFRFERPMNRTSFRDFHQPGVLLGRERAGELDVEIDAIEHAGFGFAFLAIPGMNARVAE